MRFVCGREDSDRYTHTVTNTQAQVRVCSLSHTLPCTHRFVNFVAQLAPFGSGSETVHSAKPWYGFLCMETENTMKGMATTTNEKANHSMRRMFADDKRS